MDWKIAEDEEIALNTSWIFTIFWSDYNRIAFETNMLGITCKDLIEIPKFHPGIQKAKFKYNYLFLLRGTTTYCNPIKISRG